MIHLKHDVQKVTAAGAIKHLRFQPSPLARIISSLIAGAFILNVGVASAADDVKTETISVANPTSNAASADKPAKETDKNKADKAKPVVLSTITVRSRNRVEKLQDVPLSVSVVSGQELDRLQATDISAITQRLANISWNQGNQRTSSLSIRGIGKQGQTEAQDPPVGLIVDGVNYAYNALASSYDFADIETVEVARGPQGTLLGKNASIGVINVTTKRPSFKPDSSYSVTLGQWDTVQGRFAVGGPVIDDLLAWRGNLTVSKGAGDIVNAYNTDQTYTNKERVSGRVQFLLTPTEDFSARLEGDIQPRSSETTNRREIKTQTPQSYADGTPVNLNTDAQTRLERRWFSQDPQYTYRDNYLDGGFGGNTVTSDSQRGLVTGSNGATLDLNWNFGQYRLTSITAYKDYHFNAVNDEGTPFDIHRNSGGFFNDYKQVSEEIRFSSPTGEFVDYQTGLFFLKVHNDALYQRVWGNDAGAWFASPTPYTSLDANGNGRYLLQNSLAGLSMAFNSPAGQQKIVNESEAVFGQANWHFTEDLTLTTGLRFTHENRQNLASSFIRDQGNAPELNPVSVNNVQLGGFDSALYKAAVKDANGVVITPASGGALTGTNSVEQLSLADKVANKYYGVAIAGAPGSTYASLTAAQQIQVAHAKALRQAQIGVLFNETELEKFEETQPSWVLSPSYKINKNITTYLALQHGEKAGISQATNGISNKVKAEKTDAYEIGLKSTLLDNSLVFNIALFRMDITDYQQSSQIVDLYTTAQNANGLTSYTNATANIPEVRSQGMEIDSIYNGIEHLSLRFAGAYTDAKYVEFTNAAQPNEFGNLQASQPYRDVSGEQLPGAAKVTFNIGADYRLPVWNDKEFHASLNTLYTGKYNSDNNLSSYGWIPAAYSTDFSIGIGNRKGTFDVNLVVKNLFDDDTPRTKTWNLYTPAVPRWIGVTFSGKI
ncbi:MAG: TonB-dependent receptor [Gammaproteobacteria bacterium]|nr:MAG: TonB-dependent receptor [Gammaproteobacteria bacterium]